MVFSESASRAVYPFRAYKFCNSISNEIGSYTEMDRNVCSVSLDIASNRRSTL